MSRALVVETDRRLIRELSMSLEALGFEVVVARSGVEALRAMQRARPEIVILGPVPSWLGGPGDRRAAASAPRTDMPAIWVLDAKPRPMQERFKVIDDSVVVFFDARELLGRINALRRRGLPAGQASIVRAGMLEVDESQWAASVEGRAVALTAKEFALLRTLLYARGRVLTRHHLRGSVWDLSERFDSRTVDVHVGRLRRKLGRAGRYIVTVRGVGYRFVAPVEFVIPCDAHG